jgi:hypothetical protein
VRRWALRASLPFALLLIPAPGASAASCIATASGPWSSSSTWICGTLPAVPDEDDAVLIPAGRVVSLADGDTESAARLTLRGTLALSDQSELDADGFTASGGTVSGPQYAMLVVTVATGEQAIVDSAGLTVNGAYLNVTGDGTLALSGPLTLRDGGWVESDIDATWAGAAPWQLGGAAGSPASGFEMFGARLTIAGATAAQISGAGDGVIQLDGGASLVKQDATTTRLDVGVLLDNADIQVLAGKLAGRFQGIGSLTIAAGATLALAGSGQQLAPPAFTAAGGTLEVEADADVAIVLPGAPALRRLVVAAGAALDVGIDYGDGPVEASAPADALADEIAIGAGGTLAIDAGAGTLALASDDTLSGSGTVDGALENRGGTVSPNGALRISGAYTQAAGGTLALDRRSASEGDSLRVEGSVTLAGTLRVATSYSPAATATPLVLAAAAKPAGAFAKLLAPLPGGNAWEASYGATGVTLLAPGGAGAPAAVAKPTLRPALPVVGGLTRCLPGKWTGAHSLAYQWLRGGKPVARATKQRYRVAPADRGRRLACRVTATATGGARAAATSNRARVRTGLRIGKVTARPGGRFSVTLRCAAAERRCSGSLQVLVAGRAIASGHFAVRAPGGEVELAPAGKGARAGGAAVVRATYRNGKGAARDVRRQVPLGS